MVCTHKALPTVTEIAEMKIDAATTRMMPSSTVDAFHCRLQTFVRSVTIHRPHLLNDFIDSRFRKAHI